MPLKIFYLDDEPILCELFQAINEQPKVEIQTFINPDRFVEQVKIQNPDLIFIDYRLVGKTGDEVASQLQTETPIYLVTGELDPELSFSFAGIVTKPDWQDQVGQIIEGKIKSIA